MKLTFYFDIYPGMSMEHGITARTMPFDKGNYSKRYKLECEIPE